MKLLAKIALLPQMPDLVRRVLDRVCADAPEALAALVYAHTAPPLLDPTPPFGPAERTRNATPPGGLAAPLSLPLMATPYGISETQGGRE